MDVSELFRSCRKGDLDTVRILVEQRDVDINARDMFDSTPLYYACLCGHLQLVEYLVEVGARCEANTFDGERCLYGALTDEVRRVLSQHNLVTSRTIRRDAYDEFLRRLFESGEFSDVTFVIQGIEFSLHRCILTARSEYLNDLFSTRWHHRDRITIHNTLVHPHAFSAVMKYLYTGRFECQLDLTDNCKLIGNNFRLPNFSAMIEEGLTRTTALQRGKAGCVRVTTLVVEGSNCSSVAGDLSCLAQATLPAHLRVWPTQMPFMRSEDASAFTNVCFMVEGHRFLGHQLFFSGRSEYFRALLQDHFHEANLEGDSSLPMITLHELTAEVFTVLVHYLYCNQVNVTLDNAVEVMMSADMCLIPGLKRQCGVYLGQHLKTNRVLFVHQLARMFQLPRLEDQCVSFIAKNLYMMLTDIDFHELIISDARNVSGREETDSVVIVDEIRFHIANAVQTTSEIYEAEAKLHELELLLEELCIEA